MMSLKRLNFTQQTCNLVESKRGEAEALFNTPKIMLRTVETMKHQD